MNKVRNRSEHSIGLHIKEPVTVSDEDLELLTKLVHQAKIICNEKAAIYHDGLFGKIFESFGIEKALDNIVVQINKRTVDDLDVLFSNIFEKFWIEIPCVNIRYHGENCVLAFVSDTSKQFTKMSPNAKIKKLNESIIQINNSVLRGDPLAKTFDLILISALKAFKNADLGTIFVLKEDTFDVVSYIGYSTDIEHLKLPIKESFLYVATQGKMNKTVIINDIETDYTVFPLKISSGERIILKSVIIAPIFF